MKIKFTPNEALKRALDYYAVADDIYTISVIASRFPGGQS